MSGVIKLEYGCPICNGLFEEDLQCLKCGQIMQDNGRIEDYYGPYSPYDNMDKYEQPFFGGLSEELPCVHLFTCPRCGYDTRVGIEQVVL